MAKKKTNPKIVAKKTAKPKKYEVKDTPSSLGTHRGNKTRKMGFKQYGQFLHDNGSVVKPVRVRKNFFKSKDPAEEQFARTMLHEYVTPRKRNDYIMRVPGPSYAPKWLPESLRKAMLSLVRNNRDRLFGDNGLLAKAMQNTNGRQKALGDGLVYVNMNKESDIRNGMKEGGFKDLHISSEAINAFNDYAKAKKTFTDANGKKIAVPTTMTDIKKTLTKLLYLIPFGPDGKTF